MVVRKFRFVVILATLLLFGFIATSLLSYYSARESINSQITDTTLPLTSDNIYSEIQRDLLQPIFISTLMAQDTFLRDWTLDGEQNTQAIVRYLSEIQERFGTVSAFFVSDRTGNYYHPNGVLKTVSKEDPGDAWYFRVKTLREDYEINLDTDTADKTSLTVFINHRVYDYNGGYIGATGVGLAVDAVRDLIDSYQKRYGRQVYFVDREGNITLHGEQFGDIHNLRDIPGLAKLATEILTSPGISNSYQQDGKTVYVNSRLVPEFDWYLLVEQAGNPGQGLILRTLVGNLAASVSITAVVLFLIYLIIADYQRRLEAMATTDKLTGIANRRVFDIVFEQTVRLAQRQGKPVSAVMLDIDHFKLVNDTHGHPAGDRVLQMVAATLRSHVRDSDMLCRWGGEEFLLLLVDCSVERAMDVAEKIRQALAAQVVEYAGHEIRFTASFGVTEHRKGDTESSLVKRADEALYNAKANGRDRVEQVY